MVVDTNESGHLRDFVDCEMWFGQEAGTVLLAVNLLMMRVMVPFMFDTK